jgi:hypothetical protein
MGHPKGGSAGIVDFVSTVEFMKNAKSLPIGDDYPGTH